MINIKVLIVLDHKEIDILGIITVEIIIEEIEQILFDCLLKETTDKQIKK